MDPVQFYYRSMDKQPKEALLRRLRRVTPKDEYNALCKKEKHDLVLRYATYLANL